MLAAVPLCKQTVQAQFKESCKCVQSQLWLLTLVLVGLCTVTLPFRAVGEVLDHFYDRFCDEMDASTIVWQLVQKKIIDDGDRTQITNVQLKRRVQNHILHACLKQKCTWDAFNTVCDMIINESGNVPMTALGRDMQRRLQTGK